MLQKLPAKRTDGLHIHRFKNETVVHDEYNCKVHVLNSVASTIWEACDGQTLTEDMVSQIRNEFCVDSDSDIYADLERTTQMFRDAGLLAD